MAHQAFLGKKNTVVQHLDAYRTALDLLAVPTGRGCIGESLGGGIIKGNELFKARGAGGLKKMKSKRGLHTVTFRFLSGRR